MGKVLSETITNKQTNKPTPIGVQDRYSLTKTTNDKEKRI